MVALKRISMIILLSSLLGACASSVTTGAIPEQGLTVEQIYHGVIEDNTIDRRSALKQQVRHIQAEKPNYAGYTRTSLNETRAMFKPLANPAIPIYVYPHIVQVGSEQLVKPGYTTEFFLFKSNQFALNSERY